jgi:hypothetical protein
MPSIPKATSRGFSNALFLLCEKANIPCLIVKGFKDAVPHCWNYVKLNDKWWFVDVFSNAPTSSDSYKYNYFLRTTPLNYYSCGMVPNITEATGSLIKYGDVDQNGSLTANDVAYINQYVLNPSAINISEAGLIAADVTADGNITMNDVANLQTKVLDESFKMPVEKKFNNI